MLCPHPTFEKMTADVQWSVAGGSRQGQKHVGAGLPNQDAIAHAELDDGAGLILAVADGHGSEMHFRSDVGARLAVEVTVDVLRSFAGQVEPSAPGSVILDQAQAVLRTELTGRWRERIGKNLQVSPFRENELGRVAAFAGWAGKERIEAHPVLAYGSTLLGVLATPGYVLSAQLGDGDILFVDRAGQMTRGVPQDQMVAIGLTASLAQQHARESVRVSVRAAPDELPALVIAASDGYVGAYPSADDFWSSGRIWLESARSEEPDGLATRLEKFLDWASRTGACDDVTVGLLINAAGLRESDDGPVRDRTFLPGKIGSVVDSVRKKINDSVSFFGWLPS